MLKNLSMIAFITTGLLINVHAFFYDIGLIAALKLFVPNYESELLYASLHVMLDHI